MVRTQQIRGDLPNLGFVGDDSDEEIRIQRSLMTVRGRPGPRRLYPRHGVVVAIRPAGAPPRHARADRRVSPDFVTISLVLPDEAVQPRLAVPFSWSPLHTLDSLLLVILLGSLLLAPEYRRQAILLPPSARSAITPWTSRS